MRDTGAVLVSKVKGLDTGTSSARERPEFAVAELVCSICHKPLRPARRHPPRGFQVLPLSDSIECSGTLDRGEVIRTRRGHENVVEAVGVAVRSQSVGQHVPLDYAIDNCSERTVQLILATHRCHAQWPGTRAHR